MAPISNPYFPSPSISNLPTRQRWLLQCFFIPAFAIIVASYVHLNPDRMIRDAQVFPLTIFSEMVMFGFVTVIAAAITSMGLKGLRIANLSRLGRMIGGTVFGVLLFRVEYYIGVDQPLRFLLMILASALMATLAEWVWQCISIGVGELT